jgi:hypothetical protein
MKKAYAQIWEESVLGKGVSEDGVSIHLTPQNSKNFIKNIYMDRENKDVPNSYDRVYGELFEVQISNSLYYELCDSGLGIRIPQHAFNNLKNLGEIRFLEDDIHY